MCGLGTNLSIWMHRGRRRSRRLLLLLLKVVSAAPVDVGAQKAAAVLMVVVVLAVVRRHRKPAVEVISILKSIEQQGHWKVELITGTRSNSVSNLSSKKIKIVVRMFFVSKL